MDVFVSYAREDWARAAALVDAIAARGWSVWWDRRIKPGEVFADVIERELAAARCVVVLWSSASVSAEWVVAEAAEGAKRKILIPASFEAVTLPLQFRRTHAADLTDWSPGKPSTELDELLDSIGTLLGNSIEPSGASSRKQHSPSMKAAGGLLAGVIVALILQSQQGEMKQTRLGAIAAKPSSAVIGNPFAEEYDRVALDDMRVYGYAQLDVTTFERMQSWSSEWELRFVDATRDGKIVRIYHAMNRQSCDHRFVSEWEGERQGASPWRVVATCDGSRS